jgi:hypothetical protein
MRLHDMTPQHWLILGDLFGSDKYMLHKSILKSMHIIEAPRFHEADEIIIYKLPHDVYSVQRGRDITELSKSALNYDVVKTKYILLVDNEPFYYAYSLKLNTLVIL